MRPITNERLASIRERHASGLGRERPGDVAALLREVDRLRAGIEAISYALGPALPTGDALTWDATHDAREMAHDLLNPTEGED